MFSFGAPSPASPPAPVQGTASPPASEQSEAPPASFPASRFSREYLKALHAQPMRAAWERHVAGAVKFIEERVLFYALAGETEYATCHIVDCAPTADTVFKASSTLSSNQPYDDVKVKPRAATAQFCALDPKTGLLIGPTFSGTRFSAPAMPDIVAKLRALFPGSRVEFVKAAPASGGKDLLLVNWS